MQVWLYDQLLTMWPVTSSTLMAYGRAYRNQTEKGYVPEIFSGDSSAYQKSYSEVLYNDAVNAQFFFGVGDQQKYENGSTKATVFAVFMVNVQQIKPAIVHRGDEEIRQEVERLCSQKRHGFTMTGIQTGIENVFKEYSGTRRDDGMKYRDMHPRHCFRIDFDLLYNINDC